MAKELISYNKLSNIRDLAYAIFLAIQFIS